MSWKVEPKDQTVLLELKFSCQEVFNLTEKPNLHSKNTQTCLWCSTFYWLIFVYPTTKEKTWTLFKNLHSSDLLWAKTKRGGWCERPEMCRASGSPARSSEKHLEVLKLWWLQQNPPTANRGLASWTLSTNQEAGQGGRAVRADAQKVGERKERGEQKRSILTSVGAAERQKKNIFQDV